MNTRTKPLPTYPVENHNGGQWLKVDYLDGAHPAALKDSRAGRGGINMRKGWYVVRICPCHEGHPVSQGYETKERAERVMRVMIDASMALDT